MNVMTMKRNLAVLAGSGLVLIGVFSIAALQVLAVQSSAYGPEIKSFLEYIRHEQTELHFQIVHQEISRKDFVRSKDRLDVLREAVLTHFRRTRQDLVPEYSVVAASELGDLLENGYEDLKGHKPGDAISRKWRYIGTVTRSEKFYILESLHGD